MADVESLQLAKKRLQEGESSFIIAEELKLPILIVEDMKRSLIVNIKSQAVENRIALRQSIRNKIPKALHKAIEIMEMDFNSLQFTGETDKSAGNAKDHIAFLKVQLDAAKAVIGLAGQAVGEDFLSLYTEKEEKKKGNFKIKFDSQMLSNGATQLKSTLETIDDIEVNVDKEETKL